MTSHRGEPHRVTLVPGDGIGPEVVAEATRVLEATGVALSWDVHQAGEAAVAAGHPPLPGALVESALETGVVLKGPVATRSDGAFRSVNVALRDALDLYLGIRPCRSLAGAPTRFAGVDVIVLRMTGEDLYAGIELHPDTPETARALDLIAGATGVRLPADTGLSVKPISRSAALRAATAALAHARAAGRRRVTVVHKATVMRATDAVFLDAALEAASGLPDLEVDHALVDAVCHDLVSRPETFDVLFAPVMYGDVLSDICAGLTGGLGLAPGANLGDRCAVFEPVHGTALRHAGAGRVNPIAAILSGAMLLRHLGEHTAAERVEKAVADVVRVGTTVTYDLRPGRSTEGAASTREVADAVVGALS